MFNTFLDSHFFWDSSLHNITPLHSAVFQVQDDDKISAQMLEVYATSKENSIIQLVVNLRIQLFASGYHLSLQSNKFIYMLSYPCSEYWRPGYHNTSYNITSEDLQETLCKTMRGHVDVFLIRNTYKKYLHFDKCNFPQEIVVRSSHVLFPGYEIKHSCCLSLKYACYYLVKPSGLLSWNQSQRLCHQTGKSLPTFHSQPEFDELMGLIKLASNVAVFGLAKRTVFLFVLFFWGDTLKSTQQ